MLTVGVLQGLAAGSLLHVTFYEVLHVLHVLHVAFYEVLYVLHVLHVLHFTFYEAKSLPPSLPLKKMLFSRYLLRKSWSTTGSEASQVLLPLSLEFSSWLAWKSVLVATGGIVR